MSAATEPAETLSIGMIIGGRTLQNRGWIEAIHQLMRDVKGAREGVKSGLNLNVEFQVPGNHLQPDFEGVRAGTFRKADSLLKVQVALPREAPVDPRTALLESLGAAVACADQWVTVKRHGFDTAPLHQIVASLEHR